MRPKLRTDNELPNVSVSMTDSFPENLECVLTDSELPVCTKFSTDVLLPHCSVGFGDLM